MQTYEIGMVQSESGLAAIHNVMATTTLYTMPVIGFVPKSYWHMLLANVRNLPGVFGALDIKAQPFSAVMTSDNKPNTKNYSTALVSRQPLSPSHVEMSVKQLVADVLGTLTVNPLEPLAYQGMDSLARLELRQKVQVKC